MKGTEKGTTTRAGAAAPAASGVTEERLYKPVTEEEVEALVDLVFGSAYEDDEAVLAFVRLLHGLVGAALSPLGASAVEGFARVAGVRAYTKTVHAEDAYDRFAVLAPDDRAGMYPGVADVGTVG